MNRTTALPTLEEENIDFDFSEELSEQDIASQNTLSSCITKNKLQEISSILNIAIPFSIGMDELIQRIIILIPQLKVDSNISSSIIDSLKGNNELSWCLFIIVRGSGTFFENVSGIEKAAANAITLLNKAEKSFSNMNLSGINIPNSDLSGAMLDSTQLVGANLKNCILRNSWLKNANCDNANLHGSEWYERPYIQITEAAYVCRYSNDGFYLAVACDKNIEWYEALTGRLICIFKGHMETISAIVISTDNEWLASASIDGNVKIWDIYNRTCSHTLTHEDAANSLAISLNGELLISASSDTTLRFWDPKTGESLGLIKHDYAFLSIAISPNGKWLASASKNVQLWDLETKECLHTLEGDPNGTLFVTISSDGEWISGVGIDDKIIRIWDAKTKRCIHTLSGHKDWVKSIVISDDRKWLASASWDKTIHIWDPNKEDCIHILEGHEEPIECISYSKADGGWLVSSSFDRTVRFWRIIPRNQLINFKEVKNKVTSIALSPDGRWAASADTNGKLRQWDTNTGLCFRTIEHVSAVYSVKISPDMQWIVSISDKLYLWDNKTGSCVHTIKHNEDKVLCMDISTDSNYLVSANQNIYIWDIKKGECISDLPGHSSKIYCILFSKDNQWIASASQEGELRLWNLSTKNCRILEGHKSIFSYMHSFIGYIPPDVSSLAIEPDNQWMVTASFDKTLRLWDVNSGNCLQVFKGHSGRIFSVAISPDGAWIASASEDRTVRLWNKQGKCLGILQGFVNSVNDLCWNLKDGKYFLCTASGNLISHWEMITEHDQVKMCLKWRSVRNQLCLQNVSINKTTLSQRAFDLLKQYGSKGEPVNVENEFSLTYGRSSYGFSPMISFTKEYLILKQKMLRDKEIEQINSNKKPDAPLV